MFKQISFYFLFFLTLCTTSHLYSQQQQIVKPPSTSGPQGNRVQINALDVFQTPANKAAEEKMNSEIARYKQTDSVDFIIPVVFHIINKDPFSVTDKQIQDALQELNDGFSKSGLYSASLGADTKIRFCLAKKDPDGGITNGITRTKSFFSESLNPVIEDTKLKNLIQWDSQKYINIWYIKSMELEIFPQFSCGKWFRSKAAGYATMPPNAGATDGIVITSFKSVLIHEMGHYLGLYHTFENFDCRNWDCNVDGDKVCDTPPDASVFSVSNCSDPYNSCASDTLSGFAVDVPDLTANFMDYGNDACLNMFTEGQAARMRAAIATQRSGLLQEQCAPPCNEIITASFNRDKPYPTPGELVTFTNTSTGAANHQWLVNGSVVSTSTNFTYTFSASGKHKVTLKSFNNASCFSTSTDYVIVNCGVTARFYTDKAFLSAKTSVYTDTIRFINTSEKATSYQWIMSNDKGMGEQVVSTAKDFFYIFTIPAKYTVKLIATNGSCTDETMGFPITVIDPTPDGAIYLSNAECIDQTKIKLSVVSCNFGYASIPANIPVTFYDADPRTSSAKKVTTIFLKDSIPGNCCANYNTYTIDIGRTGLNTLFAVFNDNGTTSPLSLPNTGMIEKDYTNNVSFISNVAFRDTAFPSSATLEWGDTLQLTARAGPGVVTSYVWSTPKDLSCTTCQSPILIADTSIVKRVIATSNKGCTDTAYVDIKVPPYNDYRISLNDVQCAGRDSLYVNFTVFNDFKRAVLPETLSVSFYSGNPLTGNATFLGPVFVLSDTIKTKEYTFSTFVKGISSGNIYAVVNDVAKSLPVTFPNNFLLEKDYTNNTTFKFYQPERVIIEPSDTTVLRKEFVPLEIKTPIYNPAATLWSTEGSSLFNCVVCPNPVVQVFDSSIVNVKIENRYGCFIEGSAAINIFPADMQVEILDTKCYSDNTSLVTFRICMNNNYDSVFSNIPVTFYDGTSSGRLLQPVFYTPQVRAGSCNTYTTRIAAPLTNQIYAVVNDKGTNRTTVPFKMYEETDYSNNTDTALYTPFRVSINPSDTFIQRLTSIMLTPQAVGGTLSAYLWKPAQFISCTTCPTPVVTPQYTMRYELLAQNENFCTDTAIAFVRTITPNKVYIPDAFTPNQDQLNDVLYVMAEQEASIIKDFTIFNRLGQKIFQVQNAAPNNPSFGWDGKINGRDASPGTYVYFVTMGFADGKKEMYKGTAVLIR